jgi:hypothetical protein
MPHSAPGIRPVQSLKLAGGGKVGDGLLDCCWPDLEEKWVVALQSCFFGCLRIFKLYIGFNESTVTTPQTQQELEYKVDERDWSAVKLLVEEMKEEMAERRNHLLFRITAWHFTLKVFRRVENEKMVLRSPQERDAKYHKAMLAFLRGCGEILLLELGVQQDIDSQSVGISYADMAAVVEELKMTEREWYGDMTEARRDEILKNVFERT